MGKDFWQPLLDFMGSRLQAERTIDSGDIERFLVTDSAEEAVQSIKDIALSRFGLTYGPRIKRRWFLWE
jgi:predicted Rossmann-fold nucleotide-binding protein